MAMVDVARRAKDRRRRASRKFKPQVVKLLLVAEAPPSDISRYFYFEEVREHDSLFRYVAKETLGIEPTRQNKRELLMRLKERGVFLIDLKPDPADKSPLASLVPALVRNCKKIQPEAIILIKATVFDAAYGALRETSLPVVDVRVPFPGSGQQRNFERAFRQALDHIQW